MFYYQAANATPLIFMRDSKMYVRNKGLPLIMILLEKLEVKDSRLVYNRNQQFEMRL